MSGSKFRIGSRRSVDSNELQPARIKCLILKLRTLKGAATN